VHDTIPSRPAPHLGPVAVRVEEISDEETDAEMPLDSPLDAKSVDR
jgi:hypothetical protein